MADNLTPEQRRKTMARIRSRDTKIELLVRKQLHSKGYRYRVNFQSLTGTPDIVFTRIKLAIFIDGDFWHGRDFEKSSSKLAPYWRDKIEKNIKRDELCNSRLIEQGWTVLRIWEYQVKKELANVLREIEGVVHELAESPSVKPVVRRLQENS